MSIPRSSIYAGEQMQQTDYTSFQRNVCKSFAYWFLDSYGTLPASNGFYSGLTTTGGNGNLTVNIAPGRLYQLIALDPSAWVDGITDSNTYVLMAPQTTNPFVQTVTASTSYGSGNSVIYLIEAQIVVADATAVSEPFYNSTTPASPTFLSKSPLRNNTIVFQVKAGAAAPSPVAPTVDAGWVPICNVTVANGATAIVTGNVSVPTTYPQFTGFVLNSGSTNVLLNPGSAQTGIINLSPSSAIYNAGLTIIGGVSATSANLIQDSGFGVGGLAPPTSLSSSGASSTGGNLAQSTSYYFVVTATNANGQSLGSQQFTYPVPASGTSTNQFTLNWLASPTATAYTVYAGTVSGTVYQMAALGNVLSYAVTGTIPTSGQVPPPTAGLVFPWSLVGANISTSGSNLNLAGTGSASGTQTATSAALQLLPNQNYTFSVTPVQAAQISSGSVTIGVVQNGTTTYLGTPISITSATGGRQSYTFNSGGGSVQIYFTSNNATLVNAQSFALTQPMLNPGSVAQNYIVDNVLAPLHIINSGISADYLTITGQSGTANANANTSLAIAGAISHTGGHAGTQNDPYPISQLNVQMLGGKPASAYALAAGNYVTLYAGAPTLGSGNAGITGTLQANVLQSNVATGTAPLTVASTTAVANLTATSLGTATQVAGNASGNIPISNGTMNNNLVAQYLGDNTHPQSAFAVMGSANTGNMIVTGTYTVNPAGTTQLTAAYSATNSFGINSGNNVAYIQANNYPLGLIGSSIRTNGPLYVGDSTRQNLYHQDLFPSGVVRGGIPMYRVTYKPGQTGNPFAPASSGAVDFGYLVAPAGGIDHQFRQNGTQFTLDYRMVLTLTTQTTFTFTAFYNDSLSIWVDSVSKGTYNAQLQTISVTIASGTHTLDILLYCDGTAGDDGLTLFPWIPYPGGSMSTNITTALPG